MADESNMSEIPKDKVPTETLAQTFERLRAKRKPKEIPRHYFEETDPVLDETPPAQEELFRQAAVECFQLQEELVGMIDQLPWRPTIPADYFTVGAEVGVYIEKSKGYTYIRSFKENIRGLDRGTVEISFSFGHYNTEAKKRGLNTDRRLLISIHGDKPTRDEYERLAEKRLRPNDAHAFTQYYFTEDGGYAKTVTMSASVPVNPERKPFSSSGLNRAHYQSDMTPDDFEVAKGALGLLKERVRKVIGESNTPL